MIVKKDIINGVITLLCAWVVAKMRLVFAENIGFCKWYDMKNEVSERAKNNKTTCCFACYTSCQTSCQISCKKHQKTPFLATRLTTFSTVSAY